MCIYSDWIDLFNDSVGMPLSQLMQSQFSRPEFLENGGEILLAKKILEILNLN